jgi:DNA-binding MarR family transcriptional regulator
MRDTTRTLLDEWDHLINRFVFLEKRFVFEAEGLRLHPSELHVLLAIRKEPGANATRLASRLGVTKGAISQVMKRLEAKGVIGKLVVPTQKNEVTAFFTPLGHQAMEAFLESRQDIRRRFTAYLDALPEADRAVIRRFLARFAAFLP